MKKRKEKKSLMSTIKNAVRENWKKPHGIMNYSRNPKHKS